MRIGLIGAGNVSWNLVAGLQGSPFQVVQVLSSSGKSAEKLAAEFGIGHSGRLMPPPMKRVNHHWTNLLTDLDLVIIAISDNMVGEVGRLIGSDFPNTTFVHTSGSVALSALEPIGSKVGVFYPMQTFTKGRKADWREVPLFLEGGSEVLNLIRPLAEHLSDRVGDLNSAGRLRLHLGAVFVSNFVNFLFMEAEKVVSNLPDADFTTYEPLIREVVDKAYALGPVNAHTGPARRNDQVTMQKHLDLLEGKDRELYAMISELIYNRFRS